MEEDKKFTLDENSLEGLLKNAEDLIEGDKIAIAKNDAIARDPNCDLDQRMSAIARNKGILNGQSRHQKMYEETNDRLNKLKKDSNQGSDRPLTEKILNG